MKYPITFRGAILEAQNQPLALEEVSFAGPLEAGQVLVRIHYSGICGKQVEEIEGTMGGDPYLPHFLGHEGSGIVVDVGPGVRKVSAGDPVVLHWVKGTGMDAPPPSYWRRGGRVNAGWVTTFNEYGVISENRLTPLPPGTDLEAACLLGCAVTTGLGVVFHEGRIRPGDSVAIFGCGGVGVCAVQGAAMVGAHPLIAVDRKVESLALARTFGATHTLDPAEVDVLAEIRGITGGRGAESVIVATGDPQVIENAIQASAVPGSVFLVGVPPAGTKIRVDPLEIHRRRTLLGSYGGGTIPDRDIPRYLGLYREGRLRLKEMIFATVPLEKINEGIAALHSGRAGRCVVKMVEDGSSAGRV